MAKSNIRIMTDEIKLTGTLNMEEIEDNKVLLETENGEINLIEYLNGFDASEVEITLKKKIEQSII